MTEEYYILESGQKMGPFTADELLDRPLEPDDMVLLPGLTDYKPAHSLREFDEYFKDEGIYYPTKENTSLYILRLPAYIIDMLIVIFGWSFIADIFFGKYVQQLVNAFPPQIYNNPDLMQSKVEQHLDGVMIVLLSLFFTVFFYKSICEASKLQGSIGKYVFGLAVVDGLGYTVSLKQAMQRNAGKLIYQLPFFFIKFFALIINLVVIWKPLHQAFHDQFSGCYIVKKNA